MIDNMPLSNNVVMPIMMQGLALDATVPHYTLKRFEKVFFSSIENGMRGFDTSSAYGKSEKYIGLSLKECLKKGIIKREDIFITTKIHNGQQYKGNMDLCINTALKTLKVEYIDLMLLHWPVPEFYISNWKQLEKAYDSGKIRAIGLANCRERHLKALFDSDIKYKPHAVQFEYHPFRTIPDLVKLCRENRIAIQAYSPLRRMIPLVAKNELLNSLAIKYKKSIAQIILRWDIQQQIIPVFRSYNETRLKENIHIFDFFLSEDEMRDISSLNMDYKSTAESIFCPGF